MMKRSVMSASPVRCVAFRDRPRRGALLHGLGVAQHDILDVVNARLDPCRKFTALETGAGSYSGRSAS